MSTLQKFKLLATQCAVAASPARSPNTSPVFQIRRRKTLRMLLSCSSGRRLPRRDESPDQRRSIIVAADPAEKSKALIGRTLKDLFVSSSPSSVEDDGQVSEEKKMKIGINSEGFRSVINRGDRAGSPWRPIIGGYRYRLLRRAWRPILVTIPE